MLDGRNVKSFLLAAAQDFELQHLIEAVKIQRRRKRGKSFNAAVVGGKNDVLNLQAGSGGGAVGLDVGDDDSPVLRELETVGQSGRDFLGHGADLHTMNVAVLPQALVDEIHDARGDGEAQTFAATACRKNESVDAYHRSVHIDQWSAAIAGIDGGIGLDVGHGFCGIGLAGHGASVSHGDRILQTLGAADGENQLTYAGTLLREEWERWKVLLIDLEQGKIGFFVHTHGARFKDAAFPRRYGAAGVAGQRQRDADALRALDDVGVGHDVTVGIDDDSGANGVLAHDESGLRPVLFVQRAVAGDQNLDDRGRYFGGETFQSIVELHESRRCGCG